MGPEAPWDVATRCRDVTQHERPGAVRQTRQDGLHAAPPGGIRRGSGESPPAWPQESVSLPVGDDDQVDVVTVDPALGAFAPAAAMRDVAEIGAVVEADVSGRARRLGQARDAPPLRPPGAGEGRQPLGGVGVAVQGDPDAPVRIAVDTGMESLVRGDVVAAGVVARRLVLERPGEAGCQPRWHALGGLSIGRARAASQGPLQTIGVGCGEHSTTHAAPTTSTTDRSRHARHGHLIAPLYRGLATAAPRPIAQPRSASATTRRMNGASWRVKVAVR